ncbi:alpha/beta hydrolase family protein [Nocardia sp. BMG111209]|uniref:alpha/beta hydrolase n=1 Tax=Nocardia sp. BMG111209 TaxID=1160137 RepID=UPI0003A833A5|nr:alpha/beta hydrolase-fold protein [Nocardia sp. BMG111209]
MRRWAPAAILVAGLLGATLAPAGAAPETGPRTVQLTFDDPSIDTSAAGGTLAGGRTRLEVEVRLPAGYDRHPDATYPVLYLLHGAQNRPTVWTDTPGLAESVDASGAIVVMPDAGTIGMYTNWRATGGPQWADFHLGTVLPRIEHDFRIRPGRRFHAVAGISMGGQGALRYAELADDYFGTVAALSPALPDIQSPPMTTLFALAMGAAAGSAVRYEDVWGPPDGPFATSMNPMAQVGRLGNSRVFLSAGGPPCADDRDINVFALAEPVIRLQTPAFADAARAAGAEVTVRYDCGLHSWPEFARALHEAVADWGLFG